MKPECNCISESGSAFSLAGLCIFRKDGRCLFFSIDLQLFEIVCLSDTFFFVKFENWKKKSKKQLKNGFCTGFGNCWLPDVWHTKYHRISIPVNHSTVRLSIFCHFKLVLSVRAEEVFTSSRRNVSWALIISVLVHHKTSYGFVD